MNRIATNLSSVASIGLDLAKHVFHIHPVDAAGKLVISKALRRRDMLPFFASLPPCTVGMEACGSAHYWGRELETLGHAVKLIRGRCPERERRDERSAKVVRWAEKPASSQCNVRLCETRYSTTRLRPGQCGQIHETLKGSHRIALQLQILSLGEFCSNLTLPQQAAIYSSWDLKSEGLLTETLKLRD